MTEGAGTNVKMIEYFAKGVCVLSTPFGARGISAEPGTHFVEREVDEFADAIVDIAEGKHDVVQFAEEARELARTELNWERVSKRIFDRIEELR